MTFKVPEGLRVDHGRFATKKSDGNNGAFVVDIKQGVRAMVIASDGMNWEHVSVSLPGVHRCPTWEEMCLVKSLFWDDDDCVMQLHPPLTEFVNNHQYCLHLWRPIGAEIPLPPSIMVGRKELGRLV